MQNTNKEMKHYNVGGGAYMYKCSRVLWNCVCPSLPCQQVVAVVGFGPPQPATWSYHAADCRPTTPVPLVSLVQSI